MESVDSTIKKELTALAWVSALSLLGGCVLVAVRFVLTDRFFYFFLLWNLALALVPYGIAVAVFGVSRWNSRTRKLPLFWILSACWLVFYPNAPYIFTDFIHVVNRTWIRGGADVGKETLLWYDLVLCSAVAFMGHSAGLMSIDLMMRAFKGIASRKVAWLLVGIAVAVSGFGLYVGRFVRFNSWDVFIHPIDTIGRILPYLWNPQAVLLSSVFSAFILITYAVHHLSRKLH